MPDEGKTSTEVADIIRSSGCDRIQEAIRAGEQHGLSVEDLRPETAREILKIMASAKSVGGAAAPRPPVGK